MHPDNPSGDSYVLSRRGRRLKTREHVAAYRRAGLLPKALLHPIIAAKVEAPFLRGEHDTAVFQAFKEVEVAVRVAGRFSEGDFGVKLMQDAFNEKTGPLTDTSALPAERLSLMYLFAGAIGSYKNPTSHRHVAIDTVQAIEMLILASHLMSIVDPRRIK